MPAFDSQDGQFCVNTGQGVGWGGNAVANQVVSSEDRAPQSAQELIRFWCVPAGLARVERIGEESWGVREVQESEWR